MKRNIKFLLPVLLALHCHVFADADTGTDTYMDTSYYTLSAGYSGLGLNTVFHWDRIKLFPEESIISFSVAGFGPGLTTIGILSLSGDILLAKQLPGNPKLAVTGGLNSKLSLSGIEFVPYAGLIYDRWLAALGYSFCVADDEDCSTLAFNVGYILQYYREKKSTRSNDNIEKTVPLTEKPPKKTRYFRAGLEVNYPVYLSDDTVAGFFENSFPYAAVGAGLFFRIGPEPFYFTTGFYEKYDMLRREEVMDLSVLGITIARLPLMDIRWSRGFLEFPLLLSFGSGQIRFTGGVLFDFYITSWIDITVLNSQTLSVSDSSRIYNWFNERLEIFSDDDDDFNGNMFWAMGLDIDIIKYWGVGSKFLIWDHAFGKVSEGYFSRYFKPSPYQVRVYTYLVF